MLSPREDDDDDTHLCIKCNTTIVGLDSYVKHRKNRCGKTKTNESKSDLPPIESLDPTYSLGADVFFQSLELQSSVKKTSLSRLTPPIPISKPSIERKTTLAIASTSRDTPRMSPLETNLRGEDWIGGHTLRISGNEDNQTKLINAVASISGAAKKETSTYAIEYNDFKGDEESDESEESEDDDEEEHGGGKWKPPSNYTGGKWRPDSPDHDWDDQEHAATWKSLLPEVDREEDYDAPPPGHTKGKWVPGANEKTQIMQTTIQTKGSVQYWCGPCNRRLGSRAIYDKHLRSSLHLKKVLPEHELEFSGHLEPMRMDGKRLIRPSKFLDDSVYLQNERKKRQKRGTKIITNKIEVKKRKRRATFVHCAGCNSRVREHLMGKHLISHYHFRKAAGVTNAVYQQLILDNIEAIVHQSPFQCSPCKYYTNFLPNFMQHWYSDEHEWQVAFMDGIFWCSFCKFECGSSQEMLQHMSSPDHGEVVAVINRSMPIIIRKKTVLKCETCSQIFRLNIELKKHSKRTGHPLAFTATDTYQELHKCKLCKAKFKTSNMLAAHLKSSHKHKSHLCLVCSKSFDSSEEAKNHRQTSEHRINRKELLMKQGMIIKDLRKKCPYCPGDVMLRNLLVLKDHIKNYHPEVKKLCPKCGMEFILPQEVTRHIRAKECQFPDTLPTEGRWNCSQCLFSSVSQAECFFHEVLHDAPEREVRMVNGEERIIVKYRCPICPKSFRKASLRDHLRQHTVERPFVCGVCAANFTRQSSLNNHMRRDHGNRDNHSQPLADKSPFSHQSCSSSATGGHRCQIGDCSFVAPSAQRLVKHVKSHGVPAEKRHRCPQCQFCSSQGSHLRRHLVTHRHHKPYACPHCAFRSGSLENLRKHVLRSGRHKNEYLYLCKLCEYKSNMATELRKHLVADHSDQFNVKTAAEAAKNHLKTFNN